MEPKGTYVLGEDITLHSPYPETFEGEFDGQGHRVQLAMDVDGPAGMFASLGANAKVTGIITWGSVKGTSPVGAIAATSQGEIQRCANQASVSSATSQGYIGGLVGKATGGVLKELANHGAVLGENPSARFLGGIAGHAEKTEVTESYNDGAVSGQRNRAGANVGGILGYASTDTIVQRCVNGGEISVPPKATNVGGLVGWVYKATILKSYYDATMAKGANGVEDGNEIIAKSSEELRGEEFARELSTPFVSKPGHLPGFSWEDAQSGSTEQKTYELSFIIHREVEDGDVSVTLTSGEKTIAPTAGTSYQVEPGEYHYRIESEGYVAQEGSIVIKDAPVQKEITLVRETYDLVFELPEHAEVRVTTQDGSEIPSDSSAQEPTYHLVNGTYHFTVTKEGVVLRDEDISLDNNRRIKVLGQDNQSVPWDGKESKEPTIDAGVYQISTPAELYYFAEKAKQDPKISGKLLADLNMGKKEWKGIGSYQTPFVGALDGDGHSIQGLAGKSGLFDTVGAEGKITNLSLEGEITGSGNLGGIVNTLYGTVENCKFQGRLVSTGGSFGSGSLGGIAGRAQGKESAIVGCKVDAAIENQTTSYATSLNTGSIVGYAYGNIKNCYAIGTVTARTDRETNSALGGLVGSLYASGTLQNAYYAGEITGPEKGTGRLVGTLQGTVKNAYALEGTLPLVAAQKATMAPEATDVSEKELISEAMVVRLGTQFHQDKDNIQMGRPLLFWEGGKPVTDEDAKDVQSDREVLVLKEKGGEILQPDAKGQYQIRRPLTLDLVKLGTHGSTVTWTVEPEGTQGLNLDTGVVTLPQERNEECVLVATIQKGNHKEVKRFPLVLWADQEKEEEALRQIKEKLEQTSVFIEPLQAYGHTNVTQALEQYLARHDIDVDMAQYAYDNGQGVRVSFVDPGTLTFPASGDFLAKDGTITYYRGEGGYGLNYAQYRDVTFRIWKGGQPQRDDSKPGKPVIQESGQSIDVKVRVHISWDQHYLEEYLDGAVNHITWDMLRGENTDKAEQERREGDWWETVRVVDPLTKDLTLPRHLPGYPDATIRWKAKDTSVLFIDENPDGSYSAALNRPPFGGEPLTFTLTAEAVFNRIDEYTKKEATMQGEESPWVVGLKNFVVTIAPNDVDQSKEILANLDKYPEMIQDFVTKKGPLNLTEVEDDLQMPRPGELEKAGILPDRYNQRVTMHSSNEDVLEFYGYHAKIYRPLPGQEPVEVNYTIAIQDRRNNATLAEKTFTLRVMPLTQQEIDEAKAWMEKVATDDVYWEGIRGKNPSKEEVTEDLNPFVEIVKKDDGSFDYVYGMQNITFGGIEVDDLPGYDPMHAQPWREFRSSRETIISSETLFVRRPEYDTPVKVDSVLTYTKYAKYWEKFKGNPLYEEFETFYKHPVSATVTVKGTEGGENPNPQPSTLSVTVEVRGGYDGFQALPATTYTASSDQDVTAWDALTSVLKEHNYQYEGEGYIPAVTDPNGVRLGEFDHGTMSGWMYTVNGILPNLYLHQYILKDGDTIVFFYQGDEAPEETPKKSQEVLQVEKLIDAIGEVTLEKKAQIDAARAAYDALSEEEREQVDNLTTLLAAEETYKVLLEKGSEGEKPNPDVKPEDPEEGEEPGTPTPGKPENPRPEEEREVIEVAFYGKSLVEAPKEVVKKADTLVSKPSYHDVKPSDWFYTTVEACRKEGILQGVDREHFAPQGEVTRAMVVTSLYRLAKSPGVSGEHPFMDVPSTHYASDAVQWAVEKGIVKGVDETHFLPDAPITREQMAAMLYRYMGTPPTDGDLSLFNDQDKVSDWAREAVSWTHRAQLMTGYEDNTFGPMKKNDACRTGNHSDTNVLIKKPRRYRLGFF